MQCSITCLQCLMVLLKLFFFKTISLNCPSRILQVMLVSVQAKIRLPCPTKRKEVVVLPGPKRGMRNVDFVTCKKFSHIPWQPWPNKVVRIAQTIHCMRYMTWHFACRFPLGIFLDSSSGTSLSTWHVHKALHVSETSVITCHQGICGWSKPT